MDGNAAQPQSGRNKILIIVGSIVIALIFIVPLVLVFTKGSAPPGTNTSDKSSGKPGKKSTSSKVKQAPVPTPYFAWDIYTDTKFSIAFPQTWIIEKTRETEGQTVVFKPPTIPLKEYLPSFMVTIRENKEHPWLTETEDYYSKSLGYQRTTITVDGSRATRLFGTFPSRKNSSQSIHIYLIKDNFSYLIKYQYPGRRYSPESEKLFTSMLANFKFR